MVVLSGSALKTSLLLTIGTRYPLSDHIICGSLPKHLKHCVQQVREMIPAKQLRIVFNGFIKHRLFKEKSLTLTYKHQFWHMFPSWVTYEEKPSKYSKWLPFFKMAAIFNKKRPLISITC